MSYAMFVIEVVEVRVLKLPPVITPYSYNLFMMRILFKS